MQYCIYASIAQTNYVYILMAVNKPTTTVFVVKNTFFIVSVLTVLTWNHFIAFLLKCLSFMVNSQSLDARVNRFVF